jgi:hypothetical protein
MWRNEDASPTEMAEELVEILTGTRTVETDPGVREPIGVTVGYRLSLTGFDGEDVEVRWELYRRGGPSLPHDWLQDQLADRLRAEAEKDSASSYFWIPLPEEPGPFFVRLSVLDDDGALLDQLDTPSFG